MSAQEKLALFEEALKAWTQKDEDGKIIDEAS